MIAEERRRQIVAYLDKHGIARVAELAKQFGVSEMTVHRDLNAAASQGVIDKVHGGAAAKYVDEIPFHARVVQNQEEKKAVALRAAQLISPGMTIFLSPGTTIAELARVLPEMRLRIVTNSLPIAQELTLSSEHDIVLTGGEERRYAEALVGQTAQDMLNKEFMHLSFIAVTGIDAEKGLTVYSESEARVLWAATKASRKTVLLTDSSKYDKVMGPVAFPLYAVHTLISDDQIPQTYSDYCQANDIDLKTVSIARG